ncbi:MAG: cobyrinic acid a,c-diamide synthase, partial [Eggerthellaceae bacterium]|nr:cobyrinic acid a,c-diamide synthase [Eggerthellaceae bacterium]
MTGVVAPRILIGAPASGGGKTTFTCGLLHALVRRGLKAAACKCGPDYIDPMFHSEVIGAFSRNLDLFFSAEEQVRQLVADSALHSDITVIEGVMG